MEYTNVSQIDNESRKKFIEAKFKYLTEWQQKISKAAKESNNIVPEIQSFRKYIKENPIVKMYLQGGLDQIPEKVQQYREDQQGNKIYQIPRPTLSYKYHWEQLLDQWAEIVLRPPEYQENSYMGVPLSINILDLISTPFGRIFFSMDDINRHIKPIYQLYGQFLDSPESLKWLTTQPGVGWLSSNRVNYNNIVCDITKPHYGFKSWDAWFTRQYKQQFMPFDLDENIIINNSEHFPNFNMPYKNAQWHDKFWLKQQPYSLSEIFGVDQLPQQEQAYFRNSFEGGTVYQGFLTHWCYHRWRSPVSGVVEKCYRVGASYYTCNPSLSTQLAHVYVASQPFLSTTSVRQVYVIKADNPKIGRIAIIEIGMAAVSGIHNILQQGQRIGKGDLMGWFRFGGSSHVIIFDKNISNLRFDESIWKRQMNERTGIKDSIMLRVRSNLAYVQ